MNPYLQPILTPVKGAPDVVLSIDPSRPEEVFVFLGMALMEKVPRLREHVAFKMLLGRLYNSGVCASMLTRVFGVARSTLRRWGQALKSGEMERIRRAFCGQGAEKKISPQIDRYVRDRFDDLYGKCRNYSQEIQAEVKRYFKVSVSSERLRWIFKEQRQKRAAEAQIRTQEGGALGIERAENEHDPGLAGGSGGANGWGMAQEDIAMAPFFSATRNYSLQSPVLPGSGRAVPEHPSLCHHAGVLLMSHWIDTLTDGWDVQPDLVRQWVGQVLLGAVNHEQSKRLSFSSLSWLIGPTIRSVNHQRRLLGELAEADHAHALLKHNGRLLNLCEQDLFYFDPHAEEYTGMLKTLLGWSGGLHRVDKIINMDFIHTEDGQPCFVQHADNFYDMRERFFMCVQAFRGILDPPRRPLTWVADRGLYALETFRRIVDELKDHFITWEKNYKSDGWDASAVVHQFEQLKARNNAEDLRCYRFRWQEHPWPRDPRFQRVIVRALNPVGREIEVAILCSDPHRPRRSVIGVMFNRWLQENDFGYMNRHVGINELTSRAHDTYGSIGGRLDDRQVQSREYKAFRREKMQVASALKRLLLKREKQHQVHANHVRAEGVEHDKLNRQIKKLQQTSADAKQQRELKTRRRRLERLVAKHQKNETKRAEKEAELQRLVDHQTRELHNAEKRMAQSVREESRLQALIDEQFLRLDTRRKAFMDAIRISSRNIFCKLAMEFRPLYNNYRDDHFIVRELTRSPGIIHKRNGTAHILLIPSMEFQPATRQTVQTFLARLSRQINDHFGSRSMPIYIQVLDENSSTDLDIDQEGLRWVAAPS